MHMQPRPRSFETRKRRISGGEIELPIQCNRRLGCLAISARKNETRLTNVMYIRVIHDTRKVPIFALGAADLVPATARVHGI